VRRAIVALALIVFLAAGGRDREEAVGDERAGAARGARLFAAEFAPEQGLGPLFNHTSCLGCHSTPSPGGTGPDGLGTVMRVGRADRHGLRPDARPRRTDRGLPCDLAPGIPEGAKRHFSAQRPRAVRWG
jgi:hypothetical protein